MTADLRSVQHLAVHSENLARTQTTALTQTAWLYETTCRQTHFGVGDVNSKLRTLSGPFKLYLQCREHFCIHKPQYN